MVESKKEVLTKFKIRSNSVVFYPSFELFFTNRGKARESRENLQDNKVKGRLSKKSASRVRDMVENWVNACRAFSYAEKVPLDRLITFITLTLPSRQKHSDIEIKRKALNPFLIYLKRKAGVKNFIWKAEPQKNGNIHFHILVDKWVKWQKVRKIWNQILDSLGYIDEFENRHGHRDPNSTDIHGLYKDKKGKEIIFIGAYLSKYMSKTGENERLLSGRVWGCSDNLKKLECFSDYDDRITDAFFESLKNSDQVKEFSGEFFRVFVGDWMSQSADNVELMKKIFEFSLNQYFLIQKE